MQIYFLFSQIVTNENREIENFSTLFHRFSVGKAQINTKIPHFAACFSAFGIKRALFWVQTKLLYTQNKALFHCKMGSFAAFCYALLLHTLAFRCINVLCVRTLDAARSYLAKNASPICF